MISIMVAGSAVGNDIDQVKLARQLGLAIAKAGCTLINGATTGLPLSAAEEARSNGGLVVAVSPARDLDEHLDLFGFPLYPVNEMVFAGFNAGQTWDEHIARMIPIEDASEVRELKKQFQLKFRNVISVAMASLVIAVGGRIGTINELTIASDMGKPIGIVEGGGGTSVQFPKLLRRSGKQKAPVLVGSSEDLVSQIIQTLQS